MNQLNFRADWTGTPFSGKSAVCNHFQELWGSGFCETQKVQPWMSILEDLLDAFYSACKDINIGDEEIGLLEFLKFVCTLPR